MFSYFHAFGKLKEYTINFKHAATSPLTRQNINDSSLFEGLALEICISIGLALFRWLW